MVKGPYWDRYSIVSLMHDGRGQKASDRGKGQSAKDREDSSAGINI